VNSDGTMQTKSEFLESMRSGALKFATCKLGKISVRIFGDTAVVVGTDQSKGVEDSEAFDETEVFTDVWVKKGDQWQCVATHASVKEQ
jgi:hypothetical protein